MRLMSVRTLLLACTAAAGLCTLAGCVADGGYGYGYGYDYDYFGPDYYSPDLYFDGGFFGPDYYVGPGGFRDYDRDRGHERGHERGDERGDEHRGPRGGSPFRLAPRGRPPPSLPRGGFHRGGGGFHAGRAPRSDDGRGH